MTNPTTTPNISPNQDKTGLSRVPRRAKQTQFTPFTAQKHRSPQKTNPNKPNPHALPSPISDLKSQISNPQCPALALSSLAPNKPNFTRADMATTHYTKSTYTRIERVGPASKQTQSNPIAPPHRQSPSLLPDCHIGTPPNEEKCPIYMPKRHLRNTRPLGTPFALYCRVRFSDRPDSNTRIEDKR